MSYRRLDMLRRLARELLSSRESAAQAAAAIRLHALFTGLTGLDERAAGAADRTAIALPHGCAIAPCDAARCVLDGVRTARFLQGIHAALAKAQVRFPGAQLDVLYAGCGPFGALALPLAALLDPRKLRLTLLDVHPRNLEAARTLCRALALERHVAAFVEADAAAYRHPDAPHLVIIEAMQQALVKEPQVAIALNLAPQLRAGGMLLPGRITVDACLFDPVTEFADADGARRRRIALGRAFDLSASSCRASAGLAALPRVSFSIPPAGAGLALMLRTAIRIAPGIALNEYESGLTCPLLLPDIRPDPGPDRLALAYAGDARPGFRCDWTAGGIAHSRRIP